MFLMQPVLNLQKYNCKYVKTLGGLYEVMNPFSIDEPNHKTEIKVQFRTRISQYMYS